MEMKREEIVKLYKESAYKSKQIQILADLNGCDKKAIQKILEEEGIIVSPVVKNKIVDKKKVKKKTPALKPKKKAEKPATIKPNDFKSLIQAKKEQFIENEYSELIQQRVKEEIKTNGITIENFDLVVPEIILETLEDKLKYLHDSIKKMTAEAEELQIYITQLQVKTKYSK